jgi:hypothetical protein
LNTVISIYIRSLIYKGQKEKRKNGVWGTALLKLEVEVDVRVFASCCLCERERERGDL